jgi:hypothetical protein
LAKVKSPTEYPSAVSISRVFFTDHMSSLKTTVKNLPNLSLSKLLWDVNSLVAESQNYDFQVINLCDGIMKIMYLQMGPYYFNDGFIIFATD